MSFKSISLPGAAAWTLIAGLGGLVAGSSAAANDETVEPTLPVERIPSEMIERRRHKALKNTRLLDDARTASLPIEDRDLLVLLTSSKWPAGKTLTVAFLGGDSRVHERIARVASEWTKHANIKLDFGRDENGNYRRWTEDDTEYAADIRIAFNAEDRGPGWWRGWWSATGTESRDFDMAPPNSPSMNFEGYDTSTPPAGWQITVLHEFGHAIGLAHEHQHPATECDWRWEDDEGYELTRDAEGRAIRDRQGRYPGIYTVLTGPPRPWPRQLIDNNLRRLEPEQAYSFGPFDKYSIMKYFYPDWMYRRGKDSICYSPRTNAGLSQEDKARIAEFYPRDPVVAAAEVEKQRRTISAALSRLPPSSELAKHLRFKRDLLQ
jgi:hypothetical protein